MEPSRATLSERMGLVPSGPSSFGTVLAEVQQRMLQAGRPRRLPLARHQFDCVDRASALEFALTTGAGRSHILIDPSSEPVNIHLPSL